MGLVSNQVPGNYRPTYTGVRAQELGNSIAEEAFNYAIETGETNHLSSAIAKQNVYTSLGTIMETNQAEWVSSLINAPTMVVGNEVVSIENQFAKSRT